MGLHPPCSIATTLTEMERAGIAIVHRDDSWYVTWQEQVEGPYSTPEEALEAGGRWLLRSAPRTVANVSSVVLTL